MHLDKMYENMNPVDKYKLNRTRQEIEKVGYPNIIYGIDEHGTILIYTSDDDAYQKIAYGLGEIKSEQVYNFFELTVRSVIQK